MGKTIGGFMIATIFALSIGAAIGIGALVLIAYLLMYLENID
jgi:hypothetical protein